MFYAVIFMSGKKSGQKMFFLNTNHFLNAKRIKKVTKLCTFEHPQG